MHELSLASQLLDPLLRIADEQHARRIAEVEIVCGVAQHVELDAFRTAFQAVVQGTLAENAKLVLSEESLKVRCRACGLVFSAEIDNYLCPTCQIADVDVITGRDIVLRSVVCEVAETFP